MTTIFHGPGAKDVASKEVVARGRLLADPFGSNGLKVDEARKIIGLLRIPPLDGSVGVILVGPMDQAQSAASDALLKTIEELNENLFVLVLWANDLVDVAPTIQSRCHNVWCRGEENVDEEAHKVATDLIGRHRDGDIISVLEILREEKGLDVILRLVPEVIASGLADSTGPDTDMSLWQQVREVLMYTNPSRNEVVSAMIPRMYL